MNTASSDFRQCGKGTVINIKICNCKPENAWYDDFGQIKCQYCMGLITDENRLEKIKKYNTPIKK